MRPWTPVLVALLVLSTVAPAAGATAPVGPASPPGSTTSSTASTDLANATVVDGADATAATREIRLDSTLELTPDRPGEIDVTLRFTVPEEVSSLSTTLSPSAEVVSTSGFSAGEGTNRYEWDERTEAPTLTYRIPANRTTETVRFAGDAGATNRTGVPRAGPAKSVDATGAQSAGYLFVDTGPWALVGTPNPGVQWRYRGDALSLNRTTTVAGEGAAGDRMAFLGSQKTHTRRANGQTFRLVVPKAADMAEDPETVLDSLADVSGSLRVGDRDETVFLIAAPAGPNWGVRGLQTGDADAWVGAEERLDTPQNAWIHEYVHMRQGFETTTSARWVVEGSADYYAALFTLRQERIGFSEFAADLARGHRDPYADAVLTEPGTWGTEHGAGAQYVKGSLVTGELDRRTRLATDGGGTFGSVLARLNARSEPVTSEMFLNAVEEVGGDGVADTADRYTQTSSVPEMWSQPDHDEAFGELPARVAFTPPDAAVVSGPYRNGTRAAPLSLATGETLTLRTAAENVGGATGEYLLTLRVDGEPAAEATGRLDPGERTNVSVSHTFEQPGTYTVSVAGRSYRVEVHEPADPSVVSVRANRTTVGTNETVRVTATVSNDAAVPAGGEVPVVVDGERVRTEAVRLAPNATRELSVLVRFSEPGEHRVSFDDEGTTVTVRGDGVVGTDVTMPGFGAATALGALGSVAVLGAVLSALSGRRRRDR
ncbi:hypothetical protein HUG10_11225 [Halorarum halophilum]|uniref:CARDB protein n=1 Tax=Halorarum halophilum TaxID=2743090 RepID=A0A7D5GXY0_9EURY|nr:hypothetical protein [Halobaculum halophilum]QLG28089.1 hypothetical protein HUG10_11225 [Halobaculum halophilum]